MPLTMAQERDMASIRRLSGKREVCRLMERMRLVPDTKMRVVSVHNGNTIANLKKTRVAIGREIADRIIVSSK